MLCRIHGHLLSILQVNISMLVRYAVQIIGSLVIMFAVSPKLTGVLLAVVPIVAIGASRYGKNYARGFTFYTKYTDNFLTRKIESYQLLGSI